MGRARAEKAAEFEVEHNWLLKEEAERKVKKLDVTKRKLSIFLPDDDPLEGISNRLEEVQSMVKHKVGMSFFMDDLPVEQKEIILRITNTNAQMLLKERRKNWKIADFVRNAFRMVYLMVCLCHSSRRYFNPDDPEAGPAVMRKQRKLYSDAKQPIKSSLSHDMQLSLTTNPDFRTAYDLKRGLWILRATKAFKHLFPNEMEREVASVVGYERYDDNRHIGYQGRNPERFYFVLSGRIQLLKEYKLTAGCVNKPMGIWNKGVTSDPKELEQGWLRECHLVSKGPVEVLILHKEDFIRLQHTVQGPPVDFLWTIDLFKEFPCDQFFHNPDAIEFKYYGQNQIVAKDINRTPWLHVVKSGTVKVVRVQFVFDVRNEKKFATQSTEELGCGRSFSHAEAMLGLLAKQRKMKTESELSLPALLQSRARASIEFGKRGKRRKSRLLEQFQNSTNEQGDIPEIATEEEADKHNDYEVLKGRSDLTLPPIGRGQGEPNFSSNSPTRQHRVSPLTSGLISPGHRAGPVTHAPHLEPHSTFLTREKTEAATGMEGSPRSSYRVPPGVVLGKKPAKDPLVRKAYLQLDVLKPGDVFGLDDIAQKFRFPRTEGNEEVGLGLRLPGLENLHPPTVAVNEGAAISLVSDGAEVIKISKRFFLQHAQNNTMLRVETMHKSYLSTDEAKAVLYDKETWTQYKSVLMQRLIDHLPKDGHPTGSRLRAACKDL